MSESKATKKLSDPQRVEVVRQYQILDTPRLAIEAANVGTWIIDEATRVFIASARVKELFGYAPEQELSLEAALMQISDKYRDKVSAGIEDAFRLGKPYHQDFSVTGLHDRQLRWVKAVGGHYKDMEGRLSHISGVMMDITEQKQLELRKNNFIGMVSHELKTPLTSLKAYVQMLHNWAKKKKDNFTVGALAKMEKQVKKMGNMINGFLSLSQVESGKIRLNIKDFDLNELITDAIAETLLLNPGRAISFQPGEPVWLQADQDKIDQVIINFLSNAIKYSPAAGLIEIGAQVTNGMAELWVKDEGLGIAGKDKEKLFERYYRVENKQTEKIPGFGIGLYLCAEIIQHHHGSIWVESEPGKGSTFFFKLPLKAVQSAE
ncbi:MAG: ATP-binding protein [Mucilaginibacter sp.]